MFSRIWACLNYLTKVYVYVFLPARMAEENTFSVWDVCVFSRYFLVIDNQLSTPGRIV